ncbi:MAG: hypothetical protein ACKOPO_14625 [Novosphingobium sp.]
MNVVAQCEVTGANVSLGAYKTTDTVQTVADQVGSLVFSPWGYTAGTAGIGTVQLGTVTCSNGTPFTVHLAGSGLYEAVEIAIPAGSIAMYPTIKKIGDTQLPDGGSWMHGFGKEAGPNGAPVDGIEPGAVATGTAQQIMGNTAVLIQPTANYGYVAASTPLGTVGTYSGSWTATLNF